MCSNRIIAIVGAWEMLPRSVLSCTTLKATCPEEEEPLTVVAVSPPRLWMQRFIQQRLQRFSLWLVGRHCGNPQGIVSAATIYPASFVLTICAIILQYFAVYDERQM